MAVENKYVDADIVAGKKTQSAFNDGAKTVAMPVTFEVAAGDDNGSVYRLIKSVNPDLIPVSFEIVHDSITGSTDWDLGLYKTSVEGIAGTVIDGAVFMEGQSLASAATRIAPKDGLGDVSVADVQKRIYELAGDTQATKEIGYDIALTANTVGSAAGTISVLFTFVQG